MTTVTELKIKNNKTILNMEEKLHILDFLGFKKLVIKELKKLNLIDYNNEYLNIISNSSTKKDTLNNLRKAMNIEEQNLLLKKLEETNIGLLLYNNSSGAFNSKDMVKDTKISISNVRSSETLYRVSRVEGASTTSLAALTKKQIIEEFNNDAIRHTVFFGKFVQELKDKKIIPDNIKKLSNNRLANLLNYYSETTEGNIFLRGINISLTDDKKVRIINASKTDQIEGIFDIEAFLKLSKTKEVMDSIYYNSFKLIFDQNKEYLEKTLFKNEVNINDFLKNRIKRKKIPKIAFNK